MGLGIASSDNVKDLLDNSLAYDDSVKKYAIFDTSNAGTALFEQSGDLINNPGEESSESDEEDPAEMIDSFLTKKMKSKISYPL
jgi:hypothetical protein